MQLIATLKRHPRRTATVAVVLLLLGGFGLYWFAPWNLFIDKRVDEALPGAPARVDEPTDEGVTGERGATRDESPGAQGSPDADEGGSEAPEPLTLAQGGFESLEHETTGTALIIELEDGTRYLRLDGLETSNGPDLRVYLTDQPLSDDWYVYDDGAFVDLGGLKGNLGSSNYEISADVDLEDWQTAVIWCRRFSVGFGVAPLEAP